MVLRSWNEGWLRRRGKKLGGWKKNYILICGDHLYAFRSVQDRRDLNNPIEVFQCVFQNRFTFINFEFLDC